MPIRSANYTTSKQVKKIIPESIIDEIVKKTVDKAYEQNLFIIGVFLHRYNLFTVNGKIANGGELLKALKYHPKIIKQILPIVGLTEEKGQDVAVVVLQSELKTLLKTNPDAPKEVIKEMLRFVNQPPDVSLKELISIAKEDKRRNGI